MNIRQRLERERNNGFGFDNRVRHIESGRCGRVFAIGGDEKGQYRYMVECEDGGESLYVYESELESAPLRGNY